jgi:hypothetical protein
MSFDQDAGCAPGLEPLRIALARDAEADQLRERARHGFRQAGGVLQRTGAEVALNLDRTLGLPEQ